MILQLKRGYLDVSYFEQKFSTNILQRWSTVWAQYAEEGLLSHTESRIELTRQGLLRVDALLPAFFAEEHQGIRYT
jgi:oxygen-independent coproporphyrinogen-3 oxidase